MKTVLLLALTALLASGVKAADQDESKPFQLTTLTGDKYKNCRIVKATPEALTVMHDHGVTKISFDILSDEWRTKFRYDAAKAREYAREEAERVKEAEERRIAANEKRQRAEERLMDTLVAKERQRLAAEKAVAELGPPLAPAPLPGDATPNLGMAQGQPVEEIVPSLSPITQVYTPGAGSYRMYGRDRYYSDGFYPYFPIYSYSQSCYPVRPCPTPHVRPIVSGSFSMGNTVIRVNR